MATKHFIVENIPVSVADQTQAVRIICDRITSGQSFTVFTINLDHVVKLRRLPSFRAAYERAGLVLADGFPIVWAGRIQGHQPKRTTGADLIEPLCAEAARQGLSVALYGSSDEALSGAARYLQSRCPGLQIAGIHAPAQNVDVIADAQTDGIAFLKRCEPKICLIALGAPKQEIFADICASAVPNTAFICIGAGLDFLSGHQHRAPLAVQKAGLEWLWRLVHAPRRLGRRYFECAISLPFVLAAALRARS